MNNIYLLLIVCPCGQSHIVIIVNVSGPSYFKIDEAKLHNMLY